MLAAAATIVSTAALAAGSARQVDQFLCERLTSEWVGSDKQIANMAAQGRVDNSAPRETNRQIGVVAQTLNKSMLLQMMVLHKCADIPTTVNGSSDFQLAALRCQVAALSSDTKKTVDECDVSRWRRNKDMPASGPDAEQADRRALSSGNEDDVKYRRPGAECQIPPCYSPLPGGVK